MASKTRFVHVVGLDPAPIRVAIDEGADDDAILLAMGLPSSVFIRTVQPYRLQPLAADSYELVIGPEGFGGVLLEALQWLARVTAAGIIAAIDSDQLEAFVRQYLERHRPDWRFEELTEHTGTFIHDRYQRMFEDKSYREGLEDKRRETAFVALIEEIEAWVEQR